MIGIGRPRGTGTQILPSYMKKPSCSLKQVPLRAALIEQITKAAF
jgi:hypothetical protein